MSRTTTGVLCFLILIVDVAFAALNAPTWLYWALAAVTLLVVLLGFDTRRWDP